MSFLGSVKKFLTPKPKIVVEDLTGGQAAGGQAPPTSGPTLPQADPDTLSVTSRTSRISRAISAITSHASFSPSKVDQISLYAEAYENATDPAEKQRFYDNAKRMYEAGLHEAKKRAAHNATLGPTGPTLTVPGQPAAPASTTSPTQPPPTTPPTAAKPESLAGSPLPPPKWSPLVDPSPIAKTTTSKPDYGKPGSNLATIQEAKPPCSLCKGDHWLFQCPEFRALGVPEKYQHIRDSKSCIHCLNPGHILRNCTWTPERTCGVDNCKDKHHRQLHNKAGNRTYLTIDVFLAQDKAERIALALEKIEESKTTCITQTPYQTNFTLESGDYCAIRTATVMITCGNKTKRVVVAMDPCSNSTNIDAEFAEEMGLKVVQTGIEREIGFIEGSATIRSNIVSFLLSPLNSLEQFPVEAFTIKNLVSGTPVVD